MVLVLKAFEEMCARDRTRLRSVKHAAPEMCQNDLSVLCGVCCGWLYCILDWGVARSRLFVLKISGEKTYFCKMWIF